MPKEWGGWGIKTSTFSLKHWLQRPLGDWFFTRVFGVKL
jgi:hypothetical protein